MRRKSSHTTFLRNDRKLFYTSLTNTVAMNTLEWAFVISYLTALLAFIAGQKTLSGLLLLIPVMIFPFLILWDQIEPIVMTYYDNRTE